MNFNCTCERMVKTCVLTQQNGKIENKMYVVNEICEVTLHFKNGLKRIFHLRMNNLFVTKFIMYL